MARGDYFFSKKKTRGRKSFGDDDQQYQNHDQDYDQGHAPVLARAAADLGKALAGAVELALVAVDAFVDVVEQQDVALELVADLDRQLALAADALAQPVQLLVLLRDDLLVVLVDLLVRQLRVVGALLIRIVAVREEGGAVHVVVVVVVVGVGKAHGFLGRGARGLLRARGGEVRGERRVVWRGEGGGGAVAACGAELRGQIVILGAQARDLVLKGSVIERGWGSAGRLVRQVAVVVVACVERWECASRGEGGRREAVPWCWEGWRREWWWWCGG